MPSLPSLPSLVTRTFVALAALVAALLLASCTSPAGDGHTDHEHTDEPVIAGQPAGYNAEDVAFATNMIPHHQQAVDLSAMVPERTTNAELIALAEQISSAQQPEINALRVFLVQWNENPEDGSGSGGGHEGHGAMQGMVDDATMSRLQSTNGTEFDTLWLQSMIGHHEGAIEMAQAEVAGGANVDAKAMAQQIIDAQQAEIVQMRQMLEGGQNG